MVSSSASKSSSPIRGLALCSLIIVAASVIIANRDSPPLNELKSTTISPKKPYETFEQFYPHYLREHSQKTTRQWHYVGTSLFLIYLATQPLLAISIITAGIAGYAAVPFFRHVSTGIFEASILLLVYLISGRLIVHSWKRTLLPLVLGYSFAWVGHFFFEQNKPATFIYPTYSLMGDFRMMYDAFF